MRARRRRLGKARLYAEDPRRGFLPTSGVLRELVWPRDAAVRIDTGFAQGDRVGIHYDAMLAKIIVAGANRDEALGHLARALEACRIEGITTNLAALLALARDSDVHAARIYTRLIDERGASLLPEGSGVRQRAALLAALSLLLAGQSPDPQSPWDVGDAWALDGSGATIVRLQPEGEEPYAIRARFEPLGWALEIDGKPWAIEALSVRSRSGDFEAEARLKGTPVRWSARIDPERVAVWVDAEWHRFQRVSAGADAQALGADGIIRAPMPGVILAVRVADGEQVARGQALIVMEAMKMEHTLAAATAGRVSELAAKAGQRVRDGDALLKVTAPH